MVYKLFHYSKSSLIQGDELLIYQVTQLTHNQLITTFKLVIYSYESIFSNSTTFSFFSLHLTTIICIKNKKEENNLININ